MSDNRMRDVVFAYRKNFSDLYAVHGKTLVTEYANEIYNEGSGSDPSVIVSLKTVAEKNLGGEVGARVACSLQSTNYVSTVDHHGPLSHSAFFQPHLLRMALDKERNLPATIVLSCASVSLDNHTFPRGLYFYNAYGERVRIPFFSLHDRHHSVYGQRPFTKVDILKTVEKIYHHAEVAFFADEVLRDETLYSFDSYRAQVTYLNYALMQKLCPEGGDFVSLPIEDVVRELFYTLLFQEDTLISSILFRDEVRRCFLRETNGIQTSHDFTRKETTTFFWGNKDGIRIPLRVKGEYLCDEHGVFRIHLDIYSIQTALSEEKIFPNLALCLITLSSLGMNLGGGYFQVDYLPSLTLHTQNVLRMSGLRGVSWGKTDYLGGDYTFMPPSYGEAVTPLSILKNPPCLSDITYYGEKLFMKDAIDRIIPEVYYILDNKLRNEWESIVMNTTDTEL
jgi:hypothetical protein